MQQTFNADMNISNLHQNVDPSTTLPVICGVELRPTALAVTTLMLYTERADSVPIKRQLNG